MIRSIDLRHLRFVVAAHDCRSFRRAADLLSVRHSVLSRSVGQLEHLIGATLFERSSGGVRPTLAGLGAIRIARLALEQVDTLLETGRSVGCGENGQLSIGFSTSIVAGNLRATLLEFKRRLPGIDLTTVERPRGCLPNELRSGIVDIVVCPGRVLLADARTLSLWSERILVSMPQDREEVAPASVCWTDLRNETILLSKRDPEGDMKDLLVSKFLLPEERPKIEWHDVSRGTLNCLTSMGLGASLVLESDICMAFAGLTYRELNDGSGPSHLGFHAHWLRDNENPVLERFIELLVERYPSTTQPSER